MIVRTRIGATRLRNMLPNLQHMLKPPTLIYRKQYESLELNIWGRGGGGGLK